MILASASICPGCKGHLRFDKSRDTSAPKTDWRVEGSFTAERPDGVMEYCILVSVRNERNEEQEWGSRPFSLQLPKPIVIHVAPNAPE